jgi:hypothetical protein
MSFGFVPSNEHLLQGPTGEGSDLGGFMTSGDLQETPVTVRKEHKALTISYNALTLTISENFHLKFLVPLIYHWSRI